MPSQKMDHFEIEVTDTFGGQANYSWVHRYHIAVPAEASTLAIARRIKQEAGFTGVRGRSEWWGQDSYEFWPAGENVVVFAWYDPEFEIPTSNETEIVQRLERSEDHG